MPGEALGVAVPAALAGTAIGDREAASTGAAVVDPTDEDRCLAAVPAPLDALVGAGLACADAYAEGDVPAASATAGVAEVNVLALDSDALAPVTDLLAELPLDELLAPVETQLTALLGDALGELRTRCLTALDPLNVGGLLDEVLAPLADASPAELATVLDSLTDLLDDLVPTTCDLLGDVAELLVGGDLLDTITSGDILGALSGAEGVLHVSLLETTSDVAGDGDELTAAAGPVEGGTVAITVDIPLLEDLLGDLLEDVLAPVITHLSELLAPIADAVAPVPVLGDLLGTLLSSGDLGELLGGELLSIGVAPGGAAAAGDLATGATSGAASPAAVALGGSLLSLPALSDLDDALDAVAGQLDDTLLAALRDSPLVDVVAVELLPGSVTDADIGGVAGTRATSGTASVQVLGVLGGQVGGPLLDLELAPALAGVGVEVDDPTAGPTPTPTPTDPAGPGATPVDPTPSRGQLPVTGGGAALLGLAPCPAVALVLDPFPPLGSGAGASAAYGAGRRVALDGRPTSRGARSWDDTRLI